MVRYTPPKPENRNVIAIFETENDIANTTTETDLVSYTVPGKLLGTNNAVRARILSDYFNNSGSTRTFTVKVKYGATTMYEDVTLAIPTSATVHYTLDINIALFAKNATNSQGLGGYMYRSYIVTPTTGTAGGLDELGSGMFPAIMQGIDAAEDSTLNKDLKVTITLSAASANFNITRVYAVFEQIAAR